MYVSAAIIKMCISACNYKHLSMFLVLSNYAGDQFMFQKGTKARTEWKEKKNEKKQKNREIAQRIGLSQLGVQARQVLEFNLGSEHIIQRRKQVGLSVSPPQEAIINHMVKKRKKNKAISNSHSHNLKNYQSKYKLNTSQTNQQTVYGSQIGTQQIQTMHEDNNKIVKEGKQEKD